MNKRKLREFNYFLESIKSHDYKLVNGIKKAVNTIFEAEDDVKSDSDDGWAQLSKWRQDMQELVESDPRYDSIRAEAYPGAEGRDQLSKWQQDMQKQKNRGPRHDGKDWRKKSGNKRHLQGTRDIMQNMQNAHNLQFTIQFCYSLFDNVKHTDLYARIDIAHKLLSGFGGVLLDKDSTVENPKYINIEDDIENSISRAFAGTTEKYILDTMAANDTSEIERVVSGTIQRKIVDAILIALS